jgi:hypothetical protein
MKPKPRTARTATKTVTPAWPQPPEPFPPTPEAPKPCSIQAPVEELNRQVLLLSRKVQYLQNVLFRMMAAELRAGNLDASAFHWLDCDQCRRELFELVEDGDTERTVN